MTLSHIVLRRREPDLPRPYRTPGGVATTGVALVLAAAAVVATFFVDVQAAGITAAIFVAALAYFWFYSRHRLVANAPEEEFEAIGRAEAELAGD
jgi:ethanolamine permease